VRYSWIQVLLVKKYLFKILGIAIFSIAGFVFISFTYIQGVELGRQIGRCEASCSATGGKFIAIEDNTHCQCQSNGKIGWIYSIDVSELSR